MRLDILSAPAVPERCVFCTFGRFFCVPCVPGKPSQQANSWSSGAVGGGLALFGVEFCSETKHAVDFVALGMPRCRSRPREASNARAYPADSHQYDLSSPLPSVHVCVSRQGRPIRLSLPLSLSFFLEAAPLHCVVFRPVVVVQARRSSCLLGAPLPSLELNARKRFLSRATGEARQRPFASFSSHLIPILQPLHIRAHLQGRPPPSRQPLPLPAQGQGPRPRGA